MQSAEARSRKSGAFRVGVFVAHPDDETLWAGGTLLLHPEWACRVMTLCRGSDPDRSPKFRRALKELGAQGEMGDLDDGPDQHPLPGFAVEETVSRLAGDRRFDLVLTHSPQGEYTRHLRHEETGRAVLSLWRRGGLHTNSLWFFAYGDDNRENLPRAILGAHHRMLLPPRIWARKYIILTGIYGFRRGSFEARTTPRAEAFWVYGSPERAAVLAEDAIP